MANGNDIKNLKTSLYDDPVQTVETNVGGEQEAASVQLIETPQGDPNVKCPGELNTVIVTVLSNSLLDSNGLYAGVNPLNLANCNEVEKLKQQLIKDGFLAVENKGQVKFVTPPNLQRIKNYQKYNIDKLRQSLSATKYIEDPVALMANKVWSLDLLNQNDLVFEYQMYPDVLKQETIISISNLFIFTIYTEMKDEGKSDDQTFINKFLSFLVINLKANGVSLNALTYYGIPLDTGIRPTPARLGLGVQTRPTLLYMWIAQIFSIYIKNEVQGFQFGTQNKIIELENVLSDDYVNTKNQQPLISLLFAFYFLAYQTNNARESFFKRCDQLIYRLKNRSANAVNIYFREQLELLIKEIGNNIKDKELINENAYYLKTPSTLENKIQVNVLNSPNVNAKNLDTNEKKLLVNDKGIQKCRKNNQKNETALRMFYKEGNDNILNGVLPETGLGCDKTTEEWSYCVNNFFDSDRLQKVRKNLKIPYYFKNRIVKKDPVHPAVKLDYKASEALKNLKNRLMQVFAVNVKYLRFDAVKPGLELYQQDKTLWTENQKENEATLDVLWNNYINGVDVDPFKAFHKILSVGHVLIRNLTSGLKADGLAGAQRFYFLDPTDVNKNIILFNDSQINYGTKYNYQLSQVLSFYKSTYKYTDAQFNKNLFIIRFAYDPKKSGNQQYVDNIAVEETNKVKLENLNSFSDLPPRGLSLQIFPQRGVNNRLMMLFEKTVYSGVEKKKVGSPSTWADGWKESKEFYLEDNFKDNKGISASDEVASDEMFFGNATIGSIELYFKTGEKPKSIMDIKELFGSINTFEQGFQAQAAIEPNTKYYFYIKATSVTGLESYPSPVYQVELVDDGGTVFPLIEVVNFDEKEKRPETLSFSDRFRIEPALLQQAPNPSTDDVGYLTPVVWSDYDETKPRFKVRLTSKKTGKKVDFNIIYRKKIYKSELGDGPLSPTSIDKDKILISYKKNSEEG